MMSQSHNDSAKLHARLISSGGKATFYKSNIPPLMVTPILTSRGKILNYEFSKGSIAGLMTSIAARTTDA